MTTPAGHTPDLSTQLAVDRTRLAHERTLMAWVRTATSLISFGFSIYKFFEFDAAQKTATARTLSPRQFGMIMIGTGLAALALAAVDYQRNMRQMQRAYGGSVRGWAAMAVAVIVSAVGIVAFSAAFFRG